MGKRIPHQTFDGVECKFCTKCKIWKPLDEFQKNANAADGFQWNCKQCRNSDNKKYRDSEKGQETRKKYYQANKEKILQYQKDYREANKEEISDKKKQKYQTEREEVLEHNREYYQEHRLQILAQKHSYYDTHKEEIKEYIKGWKERNPEKPYIYTFNRRAREMNAEGSISVEDLKEIYSSYEGKCAYCGKEVGENFHIDHILPLSRGGSNKKENLALSCPTCNLSKGSKTLEEFLEYRSMLNKIN